MAEPSGLIYALIYITPIVDELRYIYTTTDYEQALKYSTDVYPGTTIVEFTIATAPVVTPPPAG